MLKRTISFILVLVLTLSLFSVASASFSAVDSVAEVKPESVDVTNGKFPIFEGYHTVVYKDLVYMESAYISAWRYGEYVTEYWGNVWPGVKMQYAYTDENRNKIYVSYVPDNYTSYLINNGSAKTEIYKLQDNVGIFVDGVTMPNGYWTLDTWQPEFYIYGEENTTPSVPTTSPESNTNTPEIPTFPTETAATEPTEETTTATKTEPSTPTKTTTTDPTENTTTSIETEPSDPDALETSKTEGADKSEGSGYIFGYLGDIDLTDTVNIKDATTIQKQVASLLSLKDSNVTLADVDFSGSVNIKDATTIQKWIAGITVDAPVYHLLYAPFNTSKHIHAYKFSGVAPTCTEKGYVEYSCTCGESYKDNWADAKHTYTAKTTPPTCTENGYTVFTCKCGDSYTGNVTNATGHTYTNKVVAPTCKDKGYTEYTCTCGDTYVDNWTNIISTHSYKNGVCTVCGADEPHNHSYTSTVVAPTCMVKGYTIYTCSCGDRYLDNWTESYGGHSFDDYQCTLCGTTPFNCYASWLKENGTIRDDHYEYIFDTIYQIGGMEKYELYANYYPNEGDITLCLYDTTNSELTMIFLYEDEAYTLCITGGDNYKIYTYINITTFTSNTSITPTSDSLYNNYNEVEYAQQNICLTIAAHGYVMDEEVVDVSLVDLGFYSFLSDNTEPNDRNPILSCTEFPLHLYSNDGKIYLGKLTTNQYDSNSIWNPFGTYGNKYSANSIWNEYGTYGSKYNTKSAFNPYTTTPPIIVTNSGKTIGYLTANEYLANGFSVTELELLLKQIGQ